MAVLREMYNHLIELRFKLLSITICQKMRKLVYIVNMCNMHNNTTNKKSY